MTKEECFSKALERRAKGLVEFLRLGAPIYLVASQVLNILKALVGLAGCDATTRKVVTEILARLLEDGACQSAGFCSNGGCSNTVEPSGTGFCASCEKKIVEEIGECEECLRAVGSRSGGNIES